MVTNPYAPFVATSDRLLGKWGTTATLRKPGATTGDAWAPVAGTPSDATITFVRKMQKVREPETGRIAGVQETLIIRAQEAVTPEVGDQIIIGAATRRVEWVKPISPGGPVINWQVGLDG